MAPASEFVDEELETPVEKALLEVWWVLRLVSVSEEMFLVWLDSELMLEVLLVTIMLEEEGTEVTTTLLFKELFDTSYVDPEDFIFNF